MILDQFGRDVAPRPVPSREMPVTPHVDAVSSQFITIEDFSPEGAD